MNAKLSKTQANLIRVMQLGQQVGNQGGLYGSFWRIISGGGIVTVYSTTVQVLYRECLVYFSGNKVLLTALGRNWKP